MEEEIDLREIFEIFWSKKLWIILAAVLGIIFGACYTGFFVVPEYSSSVTLVLTKATDSSNVIEEAITQSDITLNQKLISTYGKIIKSKVIIDKVITDLNLVMTYNEVYDRISVESVSNTDIMKVTVTTTDPNVSASIVNYVTEVFEGEITRIYNIKNTFIIDKGEVNPNPVNVNWVKNIVIFAMVMVIFTMMVIFIIYFFDTSIKSKADAEKLLGIPVLAVIPLAEEEGKKDEKKNK